MITTLRNVGAVLCLYGLLLGCGGGTSSNDQARRAYMGLDSGIRKAFLLGFEGYNAAHDTDIPHQSAKGEVSGSLTISGQVDATVSTTQFMNLLIEMTNYSDGDVRISDETITLTYATSADVTLQPVLNLTLQDVPYGTFTGTLAGPFQMAGDLMGDVTLDLTLSGMIEDDGTGLLVPVAGTTAVDGTATAGESHYTIRTEI